MKIILPGVPISQIRMRFSGRNGIGRVYDPREKQKREIRKEIASQNSNNNLIGSYAHPRVSFVFHMPIPSSVPKRLYNVYSSGLLKHEKKPDADNFIKLYLDCMDGIIFDGDQKVSLGPAVKLYHPYPKTIIIINETEEILSPLEVDPATWYTLFSKESGKCSSAEMASLPYFYTPDRLEPCISACSSYPVQSIHAFGLPSVVPRLEGLIPLVGTQLNRLSV